MKTNQVKSIAAAPLGMAAIAASTLMITGCSNEPSTTEAGGGGTPAETSAKVLRFSAIPDKDVSNQAARYKPLADYLAGALDVKVEFVPAANYSASVTKFVNGEIQLAWFGGLTGVQARDKVAGARAIAQGTEDPQYKSYFIANASTGLTKSAEFPAAIKDLNFSFGSKSSTSGRLMPTYFIIQETGSNPEEWFTNPVNYHDNGHDGTAEMVASGDQWNVGVLSYSTYDKMVAKGDLDPEKCPIIWETPAYADYNFTAHPNLDETFGAGFIDKLQAALLAVTDEAVLGTLNRSGIIRAENADFDSIVEVAKQLDLL